MAAVAAPPTPPTPTYETAPASKEEDKARFLSVYATLTEFLMGELKERYEVPADGAAWVRRMMDYTVPGGKLNRGLTVLHTARILSKVRGARLTCSCSCCCS
jgi:hypothetical protein